MAVVDGNRVGEFDTALDAACAVACSLQKVDVDSSEEDVEVKAEMPEAADDEEEHEGEGTDEDEHQPASKRVKTTGQLTLAQKLAELKEAKHQGLLDEDEYQETKKQIMSHFASA